MKQLVLGLVILALVASTGFAHGGSYRGPSGEVPPNMRKPEDPPPPDSGGTPTPPPEEDPGDSHSPDDPNPGRPAPPPPDGDPGGDPGRVPGKAPDAPGPGSGAVTGPGGRKNSGPPPTTYDSWEFWWGYNKDAILNLKSRLMGSESRSSTEAGILSVGKGIGKSGSSTQAPTELAIQQRIIPSLERVLDDTDLNFDIRAGAVIALAKVGSTQSESIKGGIAKRLIDVMQNRNGKQHFSVEESGALALGILQFKDEAVLNALCDRITDKRAKGNPRTRAFALLALGLLEVKSTDASYERVADTLTSTVKSESTLKDLPVCA
jgi:hypothetical protein